MITQLIVRVFIKNYEDISDPEVRNRYGLLSGTVGILVNVLLFASKLGMGLLVNSIAVIADSFNNLFDVVSSIVTILGFRLSGKPADTEHPFGHGRLEYVAGLVISFIIIIVGIEFVKSSLDRILHPVRIGFNTVAFAVILLSISAKLWLAVFNRGLAAIIGSKTLEATAFDSISDVIASGSIAVSLLVSLWTPYTIDGYMGITVAGLIIYSGISLTKQTISPLIGQAPGKDMVKRIIQELLKHKPIMGYHDMIVHSYGPGRYMVSVHAEIPGDMDIMEAHEVIDKAEREISGKLDINLTIHMDPVNMDSGSINTVKSEVEDILRGFPEVESFHDFRVVGKDDKQNLVFDVVVAHGVSEKEYGALKRAICKKMKRLHPNFECIVSVEKSYI